MLTLVKRRKVLSITVFSVSLILVMVFNVALVNRGASNEPTEKVARGFDISLLQKRVMQEKKEKFPMIMAGDVNIHDFLFRIEKEDDQFSPEIPQMVEAQLEGKLKTILYWNEAYGSTEYGFCCGQQPYIDFGCECQNCYVTNNRSHLSSVDEFDAILFHQRSLDKADLPSKRSPHQKYIMYMMESASYPFNFVSSDWNGFFNWTMTYRSDSDFYTPYGKIERNTAVDLPGDVTTFAALFGEENQGRFGQGKSKPIAWFVSNCDTPSNRMEYVKALQKHITVDIFGQCGPLKCPRSDEKACWKNIEETYYFYLAFENSICKDYATEKFFNAMNSTVVPIVLGGANYEEIAPKMSHINAWIDYRNNPGDLARYLQSLIDSPAKYSEYFWWKYFYRVTGTDSGSIAKYQCDVCKKLHEQPTTTVSVYEDLSEWWEHKSKCKKVHVRSNDK